MNSFELKKWHVWLALETLFGGSIMAILVTQIGVLQPSYVLDLFDCEVIFFLIVVSFIIGMGTGIYYQKCE